MLYIKYAVGAVVSALLIATLTQSYRLALKDAALTREKTHVEEARASALQWKEVADKTLKVGDQLKESVDKLTKVREAIKHVDQKKLGRTLDKRYTLVAARATRATGELFKAISAAIEYTPAPADATEDR